MRDELLDCFLMVDRLILGEVTYGCGEDFISVSNETRRHF